MLSEQNPKDTRVVWQSWEAVINVIAALGFSVKEMGDQIMSPSHSETHPHCLRLIFQFKRKWNSIWLQQIKREKSMCEALQTALSRVLPKGARGKVSCHLFCHAFSAMPSARRRRVEFLSERSASHRPIESIRLTLTHTRCKQERACKTFPSPMYQIHKPLLLMYTRNCTQIAVRTSWETQIHFFFHLIFTCPLVIWIQRSNKLICRHGGMTLNGMDPD